jgi:formylmethanofuran dehydrogenase subunit E
MDHDLKAAVEFQGIYMRIIKAPYDELLSASMVQIPPPKKAQIHPTLGCQVCGEGFMEICGRTASGLVVCMDCFEKLTERNAWPERV